MTVVAVTSSRTSPGATSLATGLALVWSHMVERSLLVEADPAGGVLSLRFDLSVTPSLTTFGSDVRNTYTPELVWSNTQDLRGVRCMPGPVDPRLARSWVSRITPTLIQHLPALGAPVVVDLGWIGEDGPSLPLAQVADTTLVVTSPHIAEVQSLLFQVRQLKAAGANVALVTIGSEPNDPQEIATLAGVPLAAVLPDDAKVAAALRGAAFAPNKFRRSLLWRTIGGLADSLLDPNILATRGAQPTMTRTDTLTSEEAALAGAVLSTSASPDAQWDQAADTFFDAPAEHVPAPIVAQDYPAPVGQIPAPVAIHAAAMPVTTTIPAAAQAAAHSVVGAPSLDDTVRLVSTSVEPTPARPMVRVSRPVDAGVSVQPEPQPVQTVVPVAELVASNGQRQPLDLDTTVVIGRHSDCEVIVKDDQISRRHGRIVITNDGWFFADLGSRNGSKVNGRYVAEAFLKHGDVLELGRATFTFETSSISANNEMECA